MKSNRKYRILRLLLLLVTMFAIPLVVILSQQNQETRQKAAGVIAIGMSVKGIAHYGYGDLFPSAPASDADEDLKEIKRMGGSIIRIFIGNNRISDTETANRLNNFLNKAASYNISVIVNLIDFYESGSAPQGVAYNRTDFTPHLLGDDFFTSAYKGRYKSYVQTVVNANKGHNNIYAWEPGNEIKDEGNTAAFINFMKDMSSYIKSLDPNHPVATGMVGSWHTGLTPDQLYSQLPNVDIITIHAFYDDPSYSKGTADAAWAKAHGKRFIVEEGLTAGTGDRTAVFTSQLNYWISQGAQAYLNWGFIAKNLGDNGDGDQALGIDTVWHSADYDKLVTLFQQLSGGAAIPTTPPGGGGTLLPLGSCSEVAAGNYTTLPAPDPNNPNSVSVIPQHPDRSSLHAMPQRATEHADYNLAVRGWTSAVDNRKYLISSGGSLRDPNGKIRPLLSTLLPHQTYITNNYRVYDWNWPTEAADPAHALLGTKGGAISTQPVTMIGLATTPGDKIRLPYSEYDLGSGYGGMVLYADPYSPSSNTQSITLKYTREDNTVKGYTIHIDGIAVNGILFDNFYFPSNNFGRIQLPVINPCQVIGTAIGNEVRVAVRDEGSFLDPRWAEDWWGIINPTIPAGQPTSTQPTTGTQPTTALPPGSSILLGLSPSRSDYAGQPASWQESELVLGQQACSKVIRVGLDWPQIETTTPVNGQHSYNFAPFDLIVNSAAAKGMEVIGLIVGAPPWANGGHGESALWPHLPQYNPDYEAFLQAMVTRYAGKIKQYEVWNEANNCGWHGCGGDKNQKVAEYLPVLKETYMKIKSIDSSIKVSTTGMDGADTQYLDILYSQSTGTNTCNNGVCWDAVTVHPYSLSDIDFNGLTNVHNLMTSKGDGNKPVWITEFGWPMTDEVAKANYMTNTLNRLTSSEFSFVNMATYLIMADYTGMETWGVLTNNLTPKASYNTFKSKACSISPQPPTGTQPSTPPTLTAVPPTPTPVVIPNCWNIQGPSYIRLGSTIPSVYTAQFATVGNNLSGNMNAINTSTINQNQPHQSPLTVRTSWDWNGYPGQPVNGGKSGTLAFTWQPTAAGIYQVFCGAFSTNANTTMECRGLDSTVDGPPRYSCLGPGAVITVNVSSATIPTAQPGAPDMCQMATMIGTTLTPTTPISMAAIAKPQYNIKSYIFSFYNQDSNKPISFNGQDYFIESEWNTINLKYQDLDRADANNGNNKPVNVKVQARFTDASGDISTASEYCSQYFTVANPTPSPLPSARPTYSPTGNQVSYGSIIAIMGVLVVVIIVSLNFFFGA